MGLGACMLRPGPRSHGRAVIVSCWYGPCTPSCRYYDAYGELGYRFSSGQTNYIKVGWGLQFVLCLFFVDHAAFKASCLCLLLPAWAYGRDSDQLGCKLRCPDPYMTTALLQVPCQGKGESPDPAAVNHAVCGNWCCPCGLAVDLYSAMGGLLAAGAVLLLSEL